MSRLSCRMPGVCPWSPDWRLARCPSCWAMRFSAQVAAPLSGACWCCAWRFLASLALAVALDFEGLFFLVIILPVIVLFFLLFGTMGGWVGRRTGLPAAAGIGLGLVLAWSLGVSFPMFKRHLARVFWCGWRDLNPHALRRQNLNLVRLPISPHPHAQRFSKAVQRARGENYTGAKNSTRSGPISAAIRADCCAK